MRSNVPALCSTPGAKQYKKALSEEEMELMKAKPYAKASDSKIKWAVTNYSDWRKAAIKEQGDAIDERFFAADMEDITTLDRSVLHCVNLLLKLLRRTVRRTHPTH